MRILGLWGGRVARASVVAGGYIVLASFAPRAIVAQPAALATPTADPLATLRDGNERFARRVRTGATDQAAPRLPLGKGRPPMATVLSCAESRLPAELIFDAPPGDLLVVRSLGAVVDRAVLASLEYGVEVQHAPVLVVMGHDACDAVRLGGAPDHESDSLEFVGKTLRASRRTAGESADVRTVVLANVEQVVNDVLAGSPMLRSAIAAGRVQVVGAYFDSASGLVAFSDPVVAAADGTRRH
jgi:carbonic anhydrase